jgi:hypothetical protein
MTSQMISVNRAHGPFGARKSLAISVLLFLIAVIVYNTLSPADFGIIHAAGERYWRGAVTDPYYKELFSRAVLGEGYEHVPVWAYPPQFNFVTLTFAVLPLWLSYLAFMSVTLGLFSWVLRSFSASQFTATLLMALPFLLVNILAGQNGFLTGSLGGLCLLLCLRRTGGAGVPLGLLVIKPHLALGLGAYFVLSRRWREIGVAAAVVLGTSALATVAFGVAIWGAFAHGLGEASEFLETGSYPLHRMTSLYAALRSFGVDSGIAFASQMFVALCSFGITTWAIRQSWPLERILALAALSSLLVSPYQYDYDLGMLVIALTLFRLDRSAPVSRGFRIAALALSWFTFSYGLGVTYILHWASQWELIDTSLQPISLGGFTLVALVATVFMVMLRSPPRAPLG